LNVPTTPSNSEAAQPVIIILFKFLMVSVSFVSARHLSAIRFLKRFGGLERHSSFLVAHSTMIPVSRLLQLMHRMDDAFQDTGFFMD
jgi:hypothetical protein